MQMVFLSQDDRFYVRPTPEVCARFPEGAFNPGVNVQVYAMRVDGEGDQASTWLLVPSSQGEFVWIRSAELRLARR
jgi:hypothetical protein